MIAAQTRTGSTYQREATSTGYRIIRTDANGVRHLEETVTPMTAEQRERLAAMCQR